MLKANLAKIERALKSANYTSLRPRLLAVSKKQPVGKIKALYDLGHRDFGESYVQELKAKSESDILLESCPDIRWHFIGQLQSNKLNSLINIENLVCIHSLSSYRHAVRLNKYKKILSILLQINLDNSKESDSKPNRGGFKRDDLCRDFESMLALKHLNIKGLSVILPQTEKYESNPRVGFEELAKLRSQLELDFSHLDVKLPELSMGMSQDFEEALKCGSTWIRVGRKLFGPRE